MIYEQGVRACSIRPTNPYLTLSFDGLEHDFQVHEFHGTKLAGKLIRRNAFSQQADDQFEQFVAQHQFLPRPAGYAALTVEAFFYAEFVLGHGNTVPERSGVALS